jgi:hypothetical protein
MQSGISHSIDWHVPRNSIDTAREKNMHLSNNRTLFITNNNRNHVRLRTTRHTCP